MPLPASRRVAAVLFTLLHVGVPAWSTADADERNTGSSLLALDAAPLCVSRWELPAGAAASSTGAVSSDGAALFFGGSDGALYCVDLGDARARGDAARFDLDSARASVPGLPSQFPDVSRNGVAFAPALHVGADAAERVFVARADGTLFALARAPAQGPCALETAWVTTLPAPPAAAPRVDDGGLAVLVTTSDADVDADGALSAFAESDGALLWTAPALDGIGTTWGLAGVAPALDPSARGVDRAVFLLFAGHIAVIDLVSGAPFAAASKDTTRPWTHAFSGAPVLSAVGDEIYASSVATAAAGATAGTARAHKYSVRGDGVNGNANKFLIGGKWLVDLPAAGGSRVESIVNGSSDEYVPGGLRGLPRPTARGLRAQRAALARTVRRAVAALTAPISHSLAAVEADGGTAADAATLMRALPLAARAALLLELGASSPETAGHVSTPARLPSGDAVFVGTTSSGSTVAVRIEDATGRSVWVTPVDGTVSAPPAVDANGAVALSYRAAGGGDAVRVLAAVDGVVLADAPLLRGPPRAATASPGRPVLFADALGGAAIAASAAESLALARVSGQSCPTNISSLECSGAGDCDCLTGVCVCNEDAAGAACDAFASPTASTGPSPSSSRAATPSVAATVSASGAGGAQDAVARNSPSPYVIAGAVVGTGAALAAAALVAVTVVRRFPSAAALPTSFMVRGGRPAAELESARLLPSGGRAGSSAPPTITSIAIARSARAAAPAPTQYSLQ